MAGEDGIGTARLDQQWTWISKFVGGLNSTAQKIASDPLLPTEVVERAFRLGDRSEQLNAKIHATWNRVSQEQRAAKAGDDFKASMEEAYALGAQARELSADAAGAAYVSIATKQIEFEQLSMTEARKAHETSASWLLGGMVTSACIGAIALLLVFGIVDIEGLDASVPATADATTSVIQVAGRLAFAALALWLVKFFGDLHRAHVQQMVDYRDRIAGLAIVSPLLSVSGAEQRREMIRQLIKTNLGLEHNAFRVRERPPKALSARDVERVLGGVSKAVEPVVKAMRDGKST